MRCRLLKQNFFERPAVAVAQELLGKFLVIRHGDACEARMITEVEAYIGLHDKASHAHRGQTARNLPMFGPPGHWYVYFTYGMHWMLNIVTEKAGCPAAVLIRGVEGISGPARLTSRMGIDRAFNACPAARSSGLWMEDRGSVISPARLRKGPRVGIAYAGPYWARRHLRFWIAEPRNPVPVKT